MFFDTDSRRIQVDDRIAALERDYRAGSSALGRVTGRLAAALRLPFAAAELEPAPADTATSRDATPSLLHTASTPRSPRPRNLEIVPDAAATLVRRGGVAQLVRAAES